MVDLNKIETAVRANGGGWNGYFRRQGGGWQCILFPAICLTQGDYNILSRRLTKPVPQAELTAAERKRNTLRGRADVADGTY